MEISDEASHVEHLTTQSSHPDLSLEYTNLLASCGISEKYRPKYNSVLHCKEHCGQKCKDSNLSIKPTDPDCETKFRYTGEGEILPKDDLSVEIDKWHEFCRDRGNLSPVAVIHSTLETCKKVTQSQPYLKMTCGAWLMGQPRTVPDE